MPKKTLQAQKELPAEITIRPRIVVSRNTGDAITRQTETAEPTPALRQLLNEAD